MVIFFLPSIFFKAFFVYVLDSTALWHYETKFLFCSEIHHLPLFRPNSFKLFPSSMLKLSETRKIFEVLISQILAIQFENQPRKFLAKTMASLWSFYSKWGWNDSSFFAAFSWTWERVVSHFLPIYSTYGSLATVCLNYLKLCSRWNDKWSCYD